MDLLISLLRGIMDNSIAGNNPRLFFWGQNRYTALLHEYVQLAVLQYYL